MNHAEWMAQAERLLNRMENAKYKSSEYFECKKLLTEHMQKKNAVDPVEDDEEGNDKPWEMTGPAPL
jgi:hypothetical protein